MLEQDGVFCKKCAILPGFSAIVAILSYHIGSSTPLHTKRNPTKTLFSQVVRKRQMRVHLQWARNIAPVTERAANLLSQHRWAESITGTFPAHISTVLLKKRQALAQHVRSFQQKARMSLGTSLFPVRQCNPPPSDVNPLGWKHL